MLEFLDNVHLEQGCSGLRNLLKRSRTFQKGQKVHRSCTGLSEASGFGICRVESSPFRLFLQTGHVSCCGEHRAVILGDYPMGYMGFLGSYQLQPGHDAAAVEDVVAGELPDLFRHGVILLAHRAFQPCVCGKQGMAGQRDRSKGSGIWESLV